MSRKNKTAETAILSASATEAPESLESSAVSIIEAPEALPETNKTESPVSAIPFRTLGVKDRFGYGSASITSAILSAIASGEFTRKELETSILDTFAGNDEAKRKAVKTTVSVSLSDVRRPIGKYHASRGLSVLVNPTGKLSFDLSELSKVYTAIEAGILGKLKNAKGSEKAGILESFGLRSKD
jgi:hypothetical protein